MALSALDDKTNRPDDQALKTVLGRTFARWQDLQDHLASLYEPLPGIESQRAELLVAPVDPEEARHRLPDPATRVLPCGISPG